MRNPFAGGESGTCSIGNHEKGPRVALSPWVLVKVGRGALVWPLIPTRGSNRKRNLESGSRCANKDGARQVLAYLVRIALEDHGKRRIRPKSQYLVDYVVILSLSPLRDFLGDVGFLRHQDAVRRDPMVEKSHIRAIRS